MNMNYPQDPGGRFASNVHRRVLGHLTLPSDDYGWSEPALFERMRPDVGTNITTEDELREVLAQLESDGHAVRHPGDVWQMSQDGFDLITGSIANEPSPEDARGLVSRPATIGMAPATRLNGGDAPAGVDEGEEAAQQEDVQPPQQDTVNPAAPEVQQ